MSEVGGRLVDLHDALLLDLDGTVYRGSVAVPAAASTIAVARERGLSIRYVTNNASRAPQVVAEHLVSLGVWAEVGEVSTSAQAGAAVLAERVEAGGEVVVVGSGALVDEVAAVGLVPTREVSGRTRAVVQGLSHDTGWRELAEACLAIRGGALWVACNVDKTLPTERGLLPGNGSLVAALVAATDREPVVAGKPATPLMARSAAGAERPLVVGDRLDTDIQGAVNAGFPSLFVLTGVSTPRDLLHAGPEARPTHVGADLSAVLDDAGSTAIGCKAGWDVTHADGHLSVTGSGEALDLLRTLCAVWWEHGQGAVTVSGDGLGALGLDGSG